MKPSLPSSHVPFFPQLLQTASSEPLPPPESDEQENLFFNHAEKEHAMSMLRTHGEYREMLAGASASAAASSGGAASAASPAAFEDVEATSSRKRRRGDDGSESQPPSRESTRAMRESLLCGVCIDTLVNPVQIDRCGHSFCEECVQKYWEDKDLSEHRCPECLALLFPHNYCRNYSLQATGDAVAAYAFTQEEKDELAKRKREA